jgi:site-specific DNA-methyltransferase (adenine-specific)
MLEINKTHLGDCLKLMNYIDNNSINMILCDLPYGTTQCKWDIIIPFDILWKQYERIIKDNGVIVLTGSQPFTSLLICSNLKLFKYCWVWEKSQAVGHLNAYKMPMKNTEDICVFYKNLPKYNPQIELKYKNNIRTEEKKARNNSECYGNHYKMSERKIAQDKTLPKTIIKFNNCQEHLHPTQKPILLFEYLIKTYTNENDLILDNCAGSGTTGIACLNTNRNYIMIEKDEKYFNIINDRIKNNKKLETIKSDEFIIF